jgi:hypothetical protein
MATRYWVGGTGTWDASSTTHWSASTGGSSGASAPTSADTVIFDSSSGTGTCTTAIGAAAATVTLNSSTLGLTLGANLTNSGTFTLTQGSINLAGYTLTCNIFSSTNSNTRSIAFGTGNITVTGNSATVWAMSIANNFTYTGTPTVNATYSGSTGTRNLQFGITSGATETNCVSFNISAGSDTVAVATYILNLNFTGFSGTYSNNAKTIYGSLTFSSGMTCTSGASATTFSSTLVQQNIKTNGNSTIDFPITISTTSQTVQLQDNLTIGSTRTFTLASGTLDLNSKTLSTGIFSSSNSNTRSILFGTGNITVTGSNATIWATSTATGFTYTGTSSINFTYSGSTGTRTIAQASASNGGSETNALNMNFFAGSDTITFGGASRIYNNLDFTGFSGTYTNTQIVLVGNLKFPSSGITVGAGANSVNFAATLQQQNITTGGNTLDFPIVFSGTNTYQFQDVLTQGSTRGFQFLSGTLQLKTGVTNTVGSFATTGTTLKYLQSTTAGTQATISQASGTVNATYLNIKDSYATGGAIWLALGSLGNIDGGDNTGWEFENFLAATVKFTRRKTKRYFL